MVMTTTTWEEEEIDFHFLSQTFIEAKCIFFPSSFCCVWNVFSFNFDDIRRMGRRCRASLIERDKILFEAKWSLKTVCRLIRKKRKERRGEKLCIVSMLCYSHHRHASRVFALFSSLSLIHSPPELHYVVLEYVCTTSTCIHTYVHGEALFPLRRRDLQIDRLISSREFQINDGSNELLFMCIRETEREWKARRGRVLSPTHSLLDRVVNIMHVVLLYS